MKCQKRMRKRILLKCIVNTSAVCLTAMSLTYAFDAFGSNSQVKRPAEKVSAWKGPARSPASIQRAPAQVKQDQKTIAAPAPANPVTESQLRAAIARNEKDIPSRVKLAEILKKKKDFDGMVGVLRPQNENLDRRGMLLLAEGYKGKKDYLNQVRVLELLLAQNRKDYYVQNAVGDAYVLNGKTDEAVEKFQESRKLNPNFLPTYKSLLALYQAKNENYEARNLLTDMVKVFGPKPEFYHELCRLYSIDGYLEKSADTCRAAILKDAKFAPSHMYYAQTLWDQEKKDDALRILKQAAKQFQTSEDVQDAAGEMTFNTGDFANSFKFFSQCIKQHPKSSKCYLGYAKSAFELQKYPESLDGFAALCKLDNSTLGEFRKALANLRMKNEHIWENRFDAGLNKCTAITGS